MNSEISDIIISGAGLTGCTLAALLAKQGISSTIVESSNSALSTSVAKKDPRTLSVTPATKRILSSIDIWQQLPVDKIGGFEKIQIWDENSKADIEFDCRDVCAPVLGYIVGQSVLQEALERLIKSIPIINTITGVTIASYIEDAGMINCELSDGRVISSRLLVGADGANSQIRNLAGIAVECIDYHQKAVACIVQTRIPHDKIARQRFLSTGPLAFLPMNDENQCGVVWSTQSELANALLALEDREFCHALEETFENRLGEVQHCEQRVGFKLLRNQALSYVNGLCVLVGDAAHTVHPLAGQGANMGISDAAVLSQLFQQAKLDGRRLGSRQVLRSYERWRKTENKKMTLLLEGIKNFFEEENELVSFIRGNGMMMINHSSFIKNRIMKYAMGLSGDIPTIIDSPLIKEFN